MAVIEPSTGGKAPQIEDGLYEVICLGVDERTVEEDPFGNNEKLEFHLKLADHVDDEGEDIVLDPRINKKWSEKATLYKYAQAFGLKADLAEPIDTDEFTGLKAKALITTGEPGTWPRIKELLPLKGSKPAAKSNGDEPDFDAFWKRVRAAGFERKDVAPYCNNDLTTIPHLTKRELDEILITMGVI